MSQVRATVAVASLVATLLAPRASRNEPLNLTPAQDRGVVVNAITTTSLRGSASHVLTHLA